MVSGETSGKFVIDPDLEHDPLVAVLFVGDQKVVPFDVFGDRDGFLNTMNLKHSLHQREESVLFGTKDNKKIVQSVNEKLRFLGEPILILWFAELVHLDLQLISLNLIGLSGRRYIHPPVGKDKLKPILAVVVSVIQIYLLVVNEPQLPIYLKIDQFFVLRHEHKSILPVALDSGDYFVVLVYFSALLVVGLEIQKVDILVLVRKNNGLLLGIEE